MNDLPPGVSVTDLDDDLHFISSDDEMERELEKADAKRDIEKNDV
jgi:hypothetical protein